MRPYFIKLIQMVFIVGGLSGCIVENRSNNPTAPEQNPNPSDNIPEAELSEEYLTGKTLFNSPLDPNLLINDSKFELAVFDEISKNKTEELDSISRKRLNVTTQMNVKSDCLYKDTFLKKVSNRDDIYFYDTGFNDYCKPKNDEIESFTQREVGYISITSQALFQDVALVNLQELSFHEILQRVYEKIDDGLVMDIKHRYARSTMIDSYENFSSLRTFELETSQSNENKFCVQNYNLQDVYLKEFSCDHQKSIRIWNLNDKTNLSNLKITKKIRNELVANKRPLKQKWFNDGNQLNVTINNWQGVLAYRNLEQDESPRLLIEDNYGNTHFMDW